jgi:MFS family permease
MYLQTVLGWSATDSGLSLIILMVTLNASAGLSSQVIGRVRHYKALPMACMVLAIGSVIALGLSVSAVTPLKFQIILFLIGIGFGPTAPLTQVALQNTVAARHLGTAVGAMNFGRTLMGTVLVAVFGTIVLAGVPLHGPVSEGARVLSSTSASTFAIVFFAMAGTMSVALLAVIRLEEKPLLETMPGARA